MRGQGLYAQRSFIYNDPDCNFLKAHDIHELELASSLNKRTN
jgi:hypothetical protein